MKLLGHGTFYDIEFFVFWVSVYQKRCCATFHFFKGWGPFVSLFLVSADSSDIRTPGKGHDRESILSLSISCDSEGPSVSGCVRGVAAPCRA